MTAMSRTKLLSVMLVLLAGSGAAYHLAAGPKDNPAPPKQVKEEELRLKKALRDEARKVYEHNLATHKFGNTPISMEEMCRWSRRWLEGQLDLAEGRQEQQTALRDHLERMKVVERMAQALVTAGQGRPADASAATYHRLQAELWLARGALK
jgi:hypothetical protein